ncbi:TetR/AcrR family transcriptional regulator [Nostocoides australiense]|nr:TetR family transcriptional regulator [Tetrasphaera australiensis]
MSMSPSDCTVHGAVTAVSGLRERKKARTTQQLVDAAYALLAEGGFEAMTAEAIADRAGVSRRTFFNYFPSLEAVLVRGVTDLLDEVCGALEDLPADEPLLEGLMQLASSPAQEALLHRVAVLGALGTAAPHTKTVLHTAMLDWLEWLIDFVRSRVPAGSDDLYAVSLATAIVSAAQAAIIRWAEQTGADLSPSGVAAFRATLATSMNYFRRGFDAAPIG